MAVRRNHSVLVTGGRGFIGRAVCSLLQRGLDFTPFQSEFDFHPEPVFEQLKRTAGQVNV